ncbi:MAG: hypothetical protein ACI3U1_07130 [Peptococcaceae bacterium]
MKKRTTIYLSLTVAGMILIGLGCGISVFELSNYKTADYYYVSSDHLPAIEMTTTTLEAPLSGSEPFQLDAMDWNFTGGYDIQYNNDLTDKVIIEVTAPKDLYQIALSQQGSNSYYLSCELRELEALRLTLQVAKEQYLIERLPKVHCTIYMSEAQAKQFQLNGMRDRIDSLEETYQMQIEDTQQQYSQQLETQQQDYEERLTQQQETHDQQVQQMEQQYQEQLQQKDEQIEQLQQQLDNVRSSLN